LHLKIFLSICAVIATLISFISVSDLISISSFGSSIKGAYYAEYLESTSTHGLMNDKSVVRSGFLWMSNNVMAHQLSPYFVYLFFMFINIKGFSFSKVVYLISMSVIFIAILKTLSRGGLIVVMLGSIFALLYSKKINFLSFVKYSLIFLSLLGILFISQFSAKYTDTISKRFSSVILLLKSSNISKLEGNALGRIFAAAATVKEISQKPFFGWGNGKMLGSVGKGTKNHVAYLDYIGKVGISGFVVLILLWRKVFIDFFNSKRILLNNRIYDNNLNKLLLVLIFVSFLSGFFQPQSFIGPMKLMICYIVCISYKLSIDHNQMHTKISYRNIS